MSLEVAGDGKKVVPLCYETVTEQLSFREFTAMVIYSRFPEP
jgi:hypothetical protein